MSLYLHLGAGNVIFPLDKELPHLSPMPLITLGKSIDWTNVDKYQNKGIDEAIDLWKFPWIRSSTGLPFATDSVDAIYASHLVEHIPHQVTANSKAPLGVKQQYQHMVDEYDGWFVFFHEAWRILKPDAPIYLVMPWGFSAGAFFDPTHTRYLFPQSFGYLNVEDKETATFDYHVPCRFRLTDFSLRVNPNYVNLTDKMQPEEIVMFGHSQFNAVEDFRMELRAVK